MPVNPISIRLKKLRREKKIYIGGRLMAKGATLEQVVEATGISRSRLSILEHGRTHKMQLNTLVKLADYYGVSIDYIVCRTKNPKIAEEKKPDA